MRKILLTVTASDIQDGRGVIIPVILTRHLSATDGMLIEQCSLIAKDVSVGLPFYSYRIEELIDGKIEHIYSTGSAFN